MGMIHQPLTQIQFALRAEATTSRVISILNEVLPTVGVTVDSRPTDVASQFTIDMKLAWKVTQLMRAHTPAEVLAGLPGRSGFKKFLIGLKSAGASSEHVGLLQEAFDDLLADMNMHGGGKSTYESMVLGLGASSELPLAVNQRRALVNAMSSVMGLYCRSLYALDVLGPLLKSGGFDQVRVVSHDGVFRLWAGMAWCLRVPRIGVRESGENTRSVSGFNATDDFDGRILSEYSGLSGVKLVKCSDQHPDFEDLLLESDSIGPRHAIRIVQGSRTTHESTGQEPLQSLRIDIPTEHCELDLLIHRSWLDADRTLSASVHSPGLGADLGTDDSWQQRLPIELASNVENPDAPHGAPVGWSLQQYSGLIAKAIEGSGHKRSDYVLRRVTLAYPPLPVDIVHGFAPPNE